MPISNLFLKGTSEMSSFRKVVKNPSLRPILVRIGKKFAETIILSIIPRFCNPCTALTISRTIIRIQSVIHYSVNSEDPLHRKHIIYSDKSSEFGNCFHTSCQASRIDKHKETCYNFYKYSKRPR